MLKWLAVLIALVTSANAGPAWTWVDAGGQVHYSDRPVPGAKQIELPGAQAFAAPRAPASPSSQNAGSAPQSTTNRAQPYRSIAIVTPSQQQTLWNIGPTLNVQVALEPGLQAGHRIDVYLDGQRKNLDATSAERQVPEVPRGVHTMQAVVVDSTGAEIVRSVATTFMVQQTTLLNPNNPNATSSPGAANPAGVQSRSSNSSSAGSNGAAQPPARRGGY
jgi:hypothetical protein